MPGLIGKKIGMTSVFSAEGKSIPCTVIEAGPCLVSQIKNIETDGYEAVQLAYDEKKEKNTTAPMLGHFKKAGIAPQRKLVEFSGFGKVLNLGDKVTVDIFQEDSFVDIVGTSKGKGFQGVVGRWHFGGVGQKTHGQDDRLRAPGSVGASSYPSRVFKGMRMAGHKGCDRVKIENLKVIKVIPENNILVVKGSVPGCKGSYLIIEQ